MIDDRKVKEVEDIISVLECFIEEFGHKKTVKYFDHKIISLNNCVLSYFFATNIRGCDIVSHEKVVLESRDPEYNYLFALNVKGANIKAHENVVLNSGDPEYIFLFLNKVSNGIEFFDDEKKMKF